MEEACEVFAIDDMDLLLPEVIANKGQGACSACEEQLGTLDPCHIPEVGREERPKLLVFWYGKCVVCLAMRLTLFLWLGWKDGGIALVCALHSCAL